MKTWIHFIGKQYYTEKEFLAEAIEQGISRRVAPLTIKNMAIGDMVLCAQWNEKNKRSEIFSTFQVNGLAGLSPEVNDILTKLYHGKTRVSGRKVKRKCGKYCIEVEAIYPEPVDFNVVYELCKTFPSKPMVLGKTITLESVQLPERIYSEIPFKQGFREIDLAALKIATSGLKPGSTKKIKGYFYVSAKSSPEPARQIPEMVIQSITDYERETGKKVKNQTDLPFTEED